MPLLDFLLGRRLPNREFEDRKIGAFEAVPAMGLDGLGSSAYGPEAALTVLMPLGAASLHYIGWVLAPIVGLLAILFLSYWQTIRAYPGNGGAYVVAKDNLGTNASLLAATALMIDYVLNVAVGISAGIAALVSAVPSLHAYILPLCIGVLLLVCAANLRGTLDAGRLFALPTYLFVLCFVGIIAFGLYRAIAGDGPPEPVVAPAPLAPIAESAGWWLLLHAFASGCTAMTGVEAVSNGMTAFRRPRVTYGHRTLAAICGILGLLLAGIGYLAVHFGIGAMNQEEEGYRSVLSQLAGAVVGEGFLYYVSMGSLLAVLVLSANTSFVDFPRLCRVVAEDGFLPKPFAVSGRRLVFSVGIIYLAVTAGVLLLVFGGITDHLIPLFAVGAFMTFTISQTGMVVHWRRQRRQGDGSRANTLHLMINGLGAATTGAALIVIIVAKFADGAWIILVAIPCVMLMLKTIRHYYDEVAAHIRDPVPLDLDSTRPPLVLVAIEDWNRLTDRAIELALSLSPDVIGVHLTKLAGPDSEESLTRMTAQWRTDVEEPARKRGLNPPRLMFLRAEYRALAGPLLKLLDELEARFGVRRIAVLVPELVKQRWYQYLLHTHRARRLRSALLRHGGSRLIGINVPWYLEAPDA